MSPAQEIDTGALEFGLRIDLRRGQKSTRLVEGSGLELGLGRGERPVGSPSGSWVSATERCRKAAAAASPPRDWARPADRSSSDATSSSGPAAAKARCQARRSGWDSADPWPRPTPDAPTGDPPRRSRIDRRANQGMPKPHRRPDLDELLGFGGRGHRLVRSRASAPHARAGRRPRSDRQLRAASVAGWPQAAPRDASGSAPRADREDPPRGELAKPPASSAAVIPLAVPTAPGDFPGFQRRSDP